MLAKIRTVKRQRGSQEGTAMLEFALVAFTLFLVFFGIVEMERMMLVYTTLSNTTRAATRYAIVHGSDRSNTGDVNGQSSSSSTTYVNKLVNYLAANGSLDPSKLTVNITYTKCTGCANSNDPGSTVNVEAIYAYDPFTALPLSVNLRSVSQGEITY